ncbi:MAG TPA: serine/threonine-protein kinase, partial [Thermoanaerobaculia bacterium]|nr:serine/threonine-protein kinase [Thermoanaerobaculia bacterium]
GPFDVATAVELAIQGLRGLEAIHQTGVIHRDISPDNLMIFKGSRGDLRLKIIDLGLAKTLVVDPNHEITQVGIFTGKLRYCSPEQAQMTEGESLDRRSDLYSFGLVVYELISHRLPFDGRGPAAVFQRVSEDPAPLAGRNPDVEVPELLDRVVMQALRRDRHRRYPDAVSFIEALDKVRTALSDASTREVPRVDSGRVSVASERPAAAPSSEPPARPRSRTGELSRAERDALLAQIERVGSRVQEGSQAVEQAQTLLAAGRVDEARSKVEALEASNPTARGLEELRRRLQEAEQAAADQARLSELEEMLTRYLQKKQKPLAELALGSLVEFAPNHPRRADFEQWVEFLDEEVEQDERVSGALAAGRESVAAGDFRRARRRLDALRKLDSEVADRFADELAAAEQEAESSAAAEKHREGFEKALDGGDFARAGRELAALEGTVSRVTHDAYRERLAAAQRSGARESAEADADADFKQRIGGKDWDGARRVARGLADEFPDSARPLAMIEETARLEENDRRRTTILDGERHVEGLIDQGHGDQAAMALRVLLQLDPSNPRRHKFEKQIAALEK